MFVTQHNDFVLFRTSFNSTHDLVQKFRGINNPSIDYNAPIDFAEAGLIDNSKWDYWHIDKIFNVSNDEATPFTINDCLIGANHAQTCGIAVYSPNNDKTVADIGSVWIDEKGVKFTLLRVNQEQLTFVSENVGESYERYSFVKDISGNLTYVENGKHTSDIIIEKQHGTYMSRSNRYLQKKVFVCKNGVFMPLFGSEECDFAEIREDYLIINPATVAKDLSKKRPQDGYTQNVDLALFGEPMMKVNLIYKVMPDGAILTYFNAQKLMNVKVGHYFGVMFQEKLDIYGGGAYRIIPKTKPIDCQEGVFDFTSPVALYKAPYPNSKKVTKEYYANPDSPPDRIIDLYKNTEGDFKLGFACGFLPEYDCSPEIRKNNLEYAVSLKHTRKGYPAAACGDINTLKGIGYKKFFVMTDQNPIYTLSLEGKTYIYAHFINSGKTTLPIGGRVTLLEKDGDIQWFQDCKDLSIMGNKGCAVFVINDAE
jgi:hypothetical protein